MELKNYFRDWNLFEKLYLAIGITIAILTTFITKGSIISTLYTITYITNALLYSKGKVETYIFGFTGIIFYGYLSYSQSYYGELLIIIFMTIPIMTMGLISWIKNQDNNNDTIIINTISTKEITIAIASQFLLFWAYYFILKLFNTNELIISSLSIVASLLALYFGARRSELCYLFYIINDLIVITLWIIPVINGETALLSVVIGPTLLFINDIYGIINWKKLKKDQQIRRENL